MLTSIRPNYVSGIDATQKTDTRTGFAACSGTYDGHCIGSSLPRI